MKYEMNLQVGNLKTHRVGKIASSSFKGAHGEFEGFVVLTDHFGYEVWEEAALVVLPPDFQRPEAAPAA